MDGATQVYAVLGDPVDHSLSPRIQNAAFRAAGRDAVFVALHVPAPRLEQALSGLHAARVQGLNLTAPHKEAAFALARHRSAEAEGARSANTLRWEPDGWHAHATDGIGFLAWIEESGVPVRGRSVLLLGAGGAARSVVPKLLELSPRSVQVVSRNAERARSLARESESRAKVASTAMGDVAGADSAAPWDLLIRALSVDSVGEEEKRWWRGHEKGAVVLDLNYGERAAAAREVARAHSLRYEDGVVLLIHQGAASFEFWTGERPSLQAMRDALRATS